jgi:hypothetical protein
MKRLIFTCALFALILSGCAGWTVEPLPYISPTPYPSSTPIILSATPIVLPLPVTSTLDGTPLAPTDTGTTTLNPSIPTDTPAQAVTEAVIPTSTSAPFSAVQTTILGCSNSLDITHGMGEVTNAYVTIRNTGGVGLTNVCATLNALDEGRVHPDKTKCVALLPIGYQVSEKLTVDSTFGKDSPIQVDVNLGTTLLQRVAQNTCADFGLFPSGIPNLGTVTPIPTPNK